MITKKELMYRIIELENDMVLCLEQIDKLTKVLKKLEPTKKTTKKVTKK